MRVLHVVLSLEAGGTERLVVEMCNRLAAEGDDVAICCLDSEGPLATLLDKRVPVHVFARGPGFRPSLAWRLARLATSLDADVLHCHQYTPFVYGCGARVLAPRLGMVFTEHGRLADASPSPKRRAVNRVLTHVGGSQFAVSHELRRFMLREGFAADRLGVIHNGIASMPPPTTAMRQQARRTLGLSDEHVVVGTTARFDRVKDLPTLVHAAALASKSVPALRLVVVGDGPCRADIERAARDHHLSGLLLPGYLDAVRPLLPAFDIYVNCSLSEGISVAVLEAMDAQVAVVASAVGGTPEVIRDRCDGWLVPPQSPASLADALVVLARQPERLAALGAAGRARVREAFSASAMLEAYRHAYRTALRESPAESGHPRTKH